MAFTSNGAPISGCSAVTLSSSRTAACTTTALTSGADTIKARYSGDSDYRAAVARNTDGEQGVSSTNGGFEQESVHGGPVGDFHGDGSAGRSPAPTGTVAFTSNGATISGCSAVKVTSSRTAACTTTTLTTGTDTIKGSYSGNSDYTSSSGTVTQTVDKALQHDRGFEQESFHVRPVGDVHGDGRARRSAGTYRHGGVHLERHEHSGCSAVKVTSSRTAACTTTTLTTGTDTIKASYSGDSDYTSSSGTLSQVVNSETTARWKPAELGQVGR